MYTTGISSFEKLENKANGELCYMATDHSKP